MGTAIDDVAFAELKHQLRRRERQATLARCASSVSHALATPLSVISGRVAMLQAAASDPAQLERYVRIIQEQLKVITESLQRVVAFSKTEQAALEPVDLVAAMRQAMDVMQPVASARGVTLRCTATDNLQATSDPGALLHLLTVVVSAALLGCGDRSPISLELQSTDADPPQRERGRARPGPYACFSIRCAGLGISEAVLGDPYQPWFSDGESRSADVELALAVASGIAREHGGWIEARITGASKTTLLINWPLHGAQG
jgi:signal transduction histidine kinase